MSTDTSVPIESKDAMKVVSSQEGTMKQDPSDEVDHCEEGKPVNITYKLIKESFRKANIKGNQTSKFLGMTDPNNTKKEIQFREMAFHDIDDTGVLDPMFGLPGLGAHSVQAGSDPHSIGEINNREKLRYKAGYQGTVEPQDNLTVSEKLALQGTNDIPVYSKPQLLQGWTSAQAHNGWNRVDNKYSVGHDNFRRDQ